MAGDSNYPNASLLLHCDGSNGSTTFTDTSARQKEVFALGNAQISTAQSQFGGASALLDGSGDYLTIPHHSDLDLGTGDFTIKLWARPASTAGTSGIISKPNASNFTPFMFYINGGAYLFYASSDGSSWDIASGQSIGTAVDNTAAELAVTRSGTTFRTFKDGTLISSFSSSAALYNNATNSLLVGAHNIGVGYYNGYVDEILIVKGTALWTASYTPAGSAFLDYAGQIAGSITEQLAISKWRVTATRCSDGSLAGSTTTTGSSYTVNCKTLEPCNIAIAPHLDKRWASGFTPATGDIWVPSNSETTPHLFECTTSGAVGGSEPTWNTTPTNTTSDGSAVWTCIGPLVDPITLGPKIPS